jgi:disulfide bond formation protein DsbB
MLLTPIENLIYTLVFLGQIFIVLFIIYLIIFRQYKSKITRFLKNNAIPLALLVAFIATSGSLYYSEIANFKPCDLCWFQRIFIYPQVVILAISWFKKDDSIIDYSLALLGFGVIISLYHNYIYYLAKITPFCSISSPCTQQYVTGFSYITIPVMALTAIIMMIILLLNKKLN